LAYCGGTPSTVKNGDFDGNRKVNMGDTVNWIKYLFTRGKKPVAACKKAGIARVAPPDGDAFGLSLAEWSEKYWQWNYRGADPAQAMIGKTMLVPMPSNGVQMSGDWTWDNPALMVGSIEITMPAGTPFVIPEFAWIAERYATYPDKADDILFSEADMLSCIDMDLTMDGTSIMTNANKAVFYVPPTALDPIVVYPETTYGSVAAVAFQGCAVVFAPLPVGTHTMHLYEPYIIDPNKLPFDLGVIYDNTWTITVTKK
jgi:hypothetical protein